MILTFEQALDAISDGETDWPTLTYRLPRNDLPAVLAEVSWAMDDAELAAALTQAWTLCEYPEHAVHREQWVDWFEQAGYAVDGVRARPPDQVVLYRGGGNWERMAWSADRAIAEGFRDRFRHVHGQGRLWTATVPGEALFAHIHAANRGEDEYVINPSGIVVREIRTG